MSDLSRLRAKWARLDKRLAKLRAELVEVQAWPALGDGRVIARQLTEISRVNLAITDAEATLKYVKRRVAYEERRLLEPDTKLRFT